VDNNEQDCFKVSGGTVRTESFKQNTKLLTFCTDPFMSRQRRKIHRFKAYSFRGMGFLWCVL